MKATIIAVLLILAGLLTVGLVPRLRQMRELDAEQSAANGAPAVAVITVKRGGPTTDLALPGSLEALHEAAIYARTAGYVRRWYPDIGARVQAGQLMAQIEAPELDRQTDQARSALGQLRANVALASSDLRRWKELARDSVVTAQELEQHQAAYDAAAANLAAGEADYRRLLQLQRYERVTAPFSGVVTSRSLDVGMLVADGATMGATGTASARPLFSLARTDTVRVYVNVPEDAVALVQPGGSAEVLVQSFPKESFHGRVVRNARAVDAASRTLLTEVQIPNPKAELLPGMYAQVRFVIRRDRPPLVVPANALVIRADGPEVAVVGPDHRVHFQKVDLGRDFGSSVEVTDGVDDGATLVVNPSDDVHDGSAVRVLPNVKETAG
jgi:membrane fusion protein (multidrug efflux system)